MAVAPGGVARPEEVASVGLQSYPAQARPSTRASMWRIWGVSRILMQDGWKSNLNGETPMVYNGLYWRPPILPI